ncbi:hypothetical protein Pelo_6811 [Pelomyxa schiedti]|nr:hypothetical protein Pelo_6811 [Pelomyxa schiedti]
MVQKNKQKQDVVLFGAWLGDSGAGWAVGVVLGRVWRRVRQTGRPAGTGLRPHRFGERRESKSDCIACGCVRCVEFLLSAHIKVGAQIVCTNPRYVFSFTLHFDIHIHLLK